MIFSLTNPFKRWYRTCFNLQKCCLFVQLYAWVVYVGLSCCHADFRTTSELMLT